MKRMTYTGILRLPQGFHTGDGRRLGAVDQPLFREVEGRVALSGSSLAGVLRADLERLLRDLPGEPPCSREPACRCVVCRLFGPRATRRRRSEGEDAELQASKLHVLGGVALGEPATRVRDRVGIDRRTHTAADQRKYDVEVVEGGVELPFKLRLDDPEEDELRHLEAVLRRLAAGWLFLGGKTSSGLGRAELVRLDRAELDLTRPQDLIEHLLADVDTAGATVTPLIPSQDGSWETEWDLPAATETPDPVPGTWAQLRIEIELHFPWGFLVNDPAEALGSGFDHTYVRRADGRPILPGSALRGALRGRAEQILRTLAGDAAACDLNRKDAACHEKVEKENQRRRQAGETDLSFKEESARHCQACRVFGSGRLASAVKITDFLPVESNEERPLRHEFVAVDRFTGGAAKGAKFNAEVRSGTTLAGEIHLEIGPHRLKGWGLGLLALVLRDLLLADVPLGFGTAKGLNEYAARITGVHRFWLRPPAPLAGLEARPGSARWAPSQPLDGPAAAGELAGPELRECFTTWVRELHQELAAGAGAARAEGGSPHA